MDAMKEALKRKMASYGHSPELEIEIGQEDPKEEERESLDGDSNPLKKGSDLAPSLEKKMADGEGHFVDHLPGETDGANGVMDAGDMDRHKQIVKALADGGTHGHHMGSLHQRVADKAKEKFASIAKHKKGM